MSAMVFKSFLSLGGEAQKFFTVEGFYFIIRSVNAQFYAKGIVGIMTETPTPLNISKSLFPHLIHACASIEFLRAIHKALTHINCQILSLTFLRSEFIF